MCERKSRILGHMCAFSTTYLYRYFFPFKALVPSFPFYNATPILFVSRYRKALKTLLDHVSARECVGWKLKRFYNNHHRLPMHEWTFSLLAKLKTAAAEQVSSENLGFFFHTFIIKHYRHAFCAEQFLHIHFPHLVSSMPCVVILKLDDDDGLVL